MDPVEFLFGDIASKTIDETKKKEENVSVRTVTRYQPPTPTLTHKNGNLYPHRRCPAKDFDNIN